MLKFGETLMFIDSNAKITILSALNLSWNCNDTLVKGRPFHALSIRLKGDGKITNGNKTERNTYTAAQNKTKTSSQIIQFLF